MHYISRNRNYKPDWSQLTQFKSTWFDLTGLDLSQLKRTEPNRTIYRSPSSDGLPVGDHSTISKARSVDSCQLRVLQTCYICIHTYIYISVYQCTRIRLCGQWFVSKNNDTTRNTQSPGLTYPNKGCVCVREWFIYTIHIYICYVCTSIFEYVLH